MRTLSLQDKIIEIFFKTDDFCNAFEHEFAKHQLSGNEDTPKRNRKTGLCASESITLLIAFHGGQFRNFRHFYLNYVCI
ncbi:MAG: hypothetical protein LC127_04490 [Chitinophagales bacterium]|nr:hypothetical protein [Chitinophagales bacterium]